jgi:hypothetical protein
MRLDEGFGKNVSQMVHSTDRLTMLLMNDDDDGCGLDFFLSFALPTD